MEVHRNHNDAPVVAVRAVFAASSSWAASSDAWIRGHNHAPRTLQLQQQ